MKLSVLSALAVSIRELQSKHYFTSSISFAFHDLSKNGTSGLYKRNSVNQPFPGAVCIQLPSFTFAGFFARNMKGLVSFDRTIKKDAFYWYKANWSKEPVLYITQRRVVDRMHAITPVTVYCNKGVPELFVNNKRVTAYQVGTTDVHYVFQNVPLRKGKNTIRAVIKAGDKTMEDVITWNYQPGKKQTEKVIKEKKEEHVGL